MTTVTSKRTIAVEGWTKPPGSIDENLPPQRSSLRSVYNNSSKNMMVQAQQ